MLCQQPGLVQRLLPGVGKGTQIDLQFDMAAHILQSCTYYIQVVALVEQSSCICNDIPEQEASFSCAPSCSEKSAHRRHKGSAAATTVGKPTL